MPGFSYGGGAVDASDHSGWSSENGDGTNTNPGADNGMGNSGNGVGGVTDSSVISVPTTKSYNGKLMSQCINNLKAHEGFKNNMYADSKGNVTIGIGHYLANAAMAQALGFTRTARTSLGHGEASYDERSVSSAEVENAFNAVKANPKTISSIHISNDAVVDACINDVQTTVTGLKGLYSNYDSYTDNVKTALVDMGFNLGIAKLRDSFPSFNDAVNKKDWDTAATESHRTGISNTRNTDTANQLRSAIKK